MRLPLPKLYSRCLLQLGEIGTEEAVKLLANEFYRDSRSKRILAAKALEKTRWQPSDENERAVFLISLGRYEDAAALGNIAINPLIEEFQEVREPSIRSQLCSVLLKNGDERAVNTVRDYLHQKLNKIGAIVKQTLPIEARAIASMEKPSDTTRRVVIAGHLLEGEQPDDNSPYVRGDYGSKERLEAKAKYRAYQIYQSIFRDIPMMEFESVVVRCRHGVRVHVTTFGSPTVPSFGGSDQAMTIFQTSLTPQAAQNVNWQTSSLADVERVWTLEENIIPSLHFQVMPFGYR